MNFRISMCAAAFASAFVAIAAAPGSASAAARPRKRLGAALRTPLPRTAPSRGSRACRTCPCSSPLLCRFALQLDLDINLRCAACGAVSTGLVHAKHVLHALKLAQLADVWRGFLEAALLLAFAPRVVLDRATSLVLVSHAVPVRALPDHA